MSEKNVVSPTEPVKSTRDGHSVPTMTGLWELIKDKKIILFVGSGGVGKTTVSAATALAAAVRGKKVLVVTIDPARRLANSMGLKELGNVETRIDITAISPESDPPAGELWAMMLDVKRALDELIIKYAPAEEIANRILSNIIYKAVSDSLAGTEEYVALGKLYELQKQGIYDLIVVDTAPTKHALDFFESPTRLMNLLDMSIIQWFIKPLDFVHKIGFKTFKRGTSYFIERVEKAIGLTFFTEVATFLQNFEGMFDALKERSRRINVVLKDPAQTVLGIVTTPEMGPIKTTHYLADKLVELEMPLQFLVFNRVHPLHSLNSTDKSALQDFISSEQDHAAFLLWLESQKLAFTQPAEDYYRVIQEIIRQALATSDTQTQNINHFGVRPDSLPSFTIPFFSTDISDIAGLKALSDHLYPLESA